MRDIQVTNASLGPTEAPARIDELSMLLRDMGQIAPTQDRILSYAFPAVTSDPVEGV